MRVIDLWPDFQEYGRIRGLSEWSLKSWKWRFRLFAAWCEGREIEVEGLNERVFEAYVAYLYDRPNRVFPQAKLSKATIRKHVDLLKQFGRFLMTRGLAERHYGERLKRPVAPPRVPDTYTDEQVRAIFAEFSRLPSLREGKRRKAVLLFLILDTGLRISEALHIRPRDVDFGRRMIRVFGKGGKEREVPFGRKSAELLRGLMSGLGPDEYIWKSSRTGRPITSAAVRNTLRTVQRRLREKEVHLAVHPHGFRHTFARNWILNGGDQFSLMRILGHSTVAMTNYYVQLWGADLAQKHAEIAPADRLNIDWTVLQESCSNRRNKR